MILDYRKMSLIQEFSVLIENKQWVITIEFEGMDSTPSDI